MNTNKLHYLICLILITVSCGGTSPLTPSTSSAESDSSSRLITATEGGELTSSDGKLKLTVPAGALDEDTEISIEEITEDGKVIGYDFQPDGLVFNEDLIAEYERSLDDEDLIDENGDPLDPEKNAPSAMMFLRSADDSVELIDNATVSHDAENNVLNITAPIPHFTSLITVAGNSYYAYLASLGTHYVGSDFKRDLDIRYLGYSHTDSYRGMSISYTVRSITVNEIKFETTGAIKIVSPSTITRSDHLSRRGQTSSTRPRFNCDSVGDGTVTTTVSATAVVEYTFQPENKTLVRTVNQSEVISRKGKCIARIGMNDYYNNGSSAFASVVDDDLNDVLYFGEAPAEAGTYGAYGDIAHASVIAVSDTEVSFGMELNGDVPDTNPENVPAFCLHFLVLRETGDSTGIFSNADFEFAIESLAGEEQAAVTYEYDDEETASTRDDVPVEMFIDGPYVNVLINLDDLDMTLEDFAERDFRAVTQIMQSGEFGVEEFSDTLEL